MSSRIPEAKGERIVIVGAGFAGLKLARELSNTEYQLVLIDQHNYHQFQPLLYQVATAGIHPASISFPIRRVFQHVPNVHVRLGTVQAVHRAERKISTSFGELEYHHLVIATGATTNFFGLDTVAANSYTMKSVSEALGLRNAIIENLEKAMVEEDDQERLKLMNIAIVGGGPTGVELAGALMEMKKYVFPKDFPDLDFSKATITLIEATPRLLNGMTDKSGKDAKRFLEKLGVKVMLEAQVTTYEHGVIEIKDKPNIETHNMIWAAGVRGNPVDGFEDGQFNRAKRLITNNHCLVKGCERIYALGDIALLQGDADFPNGHPQVAQVAIQQAALVAENFKRRLKDKELRGFEYNDRGSMATVGRSKAVVELPWLYMRGFIAWAIWLFVHLMAILGVKNKFFVFTDWMWYYLSYDQNLRVLIKTKNPDQR